MNRTATNTEYEPYVASAILVVIAIVWAALVPAPACADVITAWNAQTDTITSANVFKRSKNFALSRYRIAHS